MSFPCVNDQHFLSPGGVLAPQPYIQWRHVATTSVASFQAQFDVNGGDQSADIVEFQVAWTNPGPLSQNVYGLLTRAGSTVTVQPRNRVYIVTSFGAANGVAPADPVASTEFSKFGLGANMGTLTSPDRTVFTNAQTRQGERTSVVGSTVVLAAGETYKLRIKLRWTGDFWETLPVYPSESETELSYISGASRLDLYSYPVIV